MGPRPHQILFTPYDFPFRILAIICITENAAHSKYDALVARGATFHTYMNVPLNPAAGNGGLSSRATAAASPLLKLNVDTMQTSAAQMPPRWHLSRVV